MWLRFNVQYMSIDLINVDQLNWIALIMFLESWSLRHKNGPHIGMFGIVAVQSIPYHRPGRGRITRNLFQAIGSTYNESCKEVVNQVKPDYLIDLSKYQV